MLSCIVSWVCPQGPDVEAHPKPSLPARGFSTYTISFVLTQSC